MISESTGAISRYQACSNCKSSSVMEMISSEGSRFFACLDCNHRGPLVDGKGSDGLVMLLSLSEASMKATAALGYSEALARLEMFSKEAVGWDGCGGLPASEGAVKDVSPFLELAKSERLQAPGLAMGGDGSVAAVWTEKEVYISADFDGTGSYSYFVSMGEELVCHGVCIAGAFPEDLIQHLRAHFRPGIQAQDPLRTN